MIVKNLQIGFGKGKIIVKNANFELKKGELIALIGRNGTGKTTLLKTITGHLKPINGECNIQKKPIHKMSPQELSRHISIVSTERIRLSYLKVKDLLALGRFPYSSFIGKLSAEDEKVIDETIEHLEIQPLVEKHLEQLSDGELQKAWIARAIIQDTPYIILDEPTTHLDLINRFHIFQLLKRLTQEQNKTILLSTHEIELALELADKIILINEKGQLIAAPTQEFIDKGFVQTAFQQKGIRFDGAARKFFFTS